MQRVGLFLVDAGHSRCSTTTLDLGVRGMYLQNGLPCLRRRREGGANRDNQWPFVREALPHVCLP